jgi:hypothetical protein
MTTATIGRRRMRGPRRDIQAAGIALTLENAAAQSRRERSITAAVRSAWDVLAAARDSAPAFAAWQDALGYDGPVEGLFGEVCLTATTPAGVAASLYRAAAQASGSAAA